MTPYRRLLVLGALSLLLHVLAIREIARTVVPRETAQTAPAQAALALRLLAPPATPPLVPAPTPAALPVPTAPARPAAAPPAAVPAMPAPRAQAGAEPHAIVPLPATMPGRYRVRTPPSTTLDYVVSGPGAPAAAQIAWQTDGSTYQASVDGVTGPVASAGAIGDTGFAPVQSRLRLANGGAVTAAFGVDTVVLGAATYANAAGSQDPASLLLQLVGMGLAQPEQLTAEVSLNVVTAEGPVVLRFEVTDNEDVATPLGVFATRHLHQVGPSGQARLDIWLAPARDWLPVQLRLTAPDGTVTTQTVSRIGATATP